VKRAIGLVFLISCSSDGIAPSVRFTTLEDGEVTRLVSAALGLDAAQAVREFDTTAELVEGCPIVTHSDNVTTLAGGCTTAEGFPVTGLARRIIEPDAARYEFEAFVIPITKTIRVSFDGAVELSRKYGGRADEYGERTIDLLVEDPDHAVRSVLQFSCERDEGCRTDERIVGITSSAVELIGRGGALVAGRVGPWDVHTTIRGLETVEVFMAGFGGDCVSWRIVDTERSDAPFSCPRD
jgi:hypothetical protein